MDLKIKYHNKYDFSLTDLSPTYFPTRSLTHSSTSSLMPIGIIYRIFHKPSGKSLINASENVVESINNIITKLDKGTFYISEMQKLWNKNYQLFEAEDLQPYYSIDSTKYLINTWKIYFGGKDFNNLFNIDNNISVQNEDINAQLIAENKRLTDDNQYYAKYTQTLLDTNDKLLEQINILNTNLVQLQSYNYNSFNNLNQINTELLKNISSTPLEILSILTSLLSITSAELTNKFNAANIKPIDSNHLSSYISIQNENKKANIDKQNETISTNVATNIIDLNNTTQIHNETNNQISNEINNKVYNETNNQINNETQTSAQVKTNITKPEKLVTIELKKTSTELQDTKPTKHTRHPRSLLKTTNDGFIFYDGSTHIDVWLKEALDWLQQNNAPAFATELKKEITKLFSKKKVSKALQVLKAFASGKSYLELEEQFKLNRVAIMRLLDSVQTSAPAIYLAFGGRQYNSTGRPKRVVNQLLAKNIKDIPASF